MTGITLVHSARFPWWYLISGDISEHLCHGAPSIFLTLLQGFITSHHVECALRCCQPDTEIYLDYIICLTKGMGYFNIRREYLHFCKQSCIVAYKWWGLWLSSQSNCNTILYCSSIFLTIFISTLVAFVGTLFTTGMDPHSLQLMGSYWESKAI